MSLTSKQEKIVKATSGHYVVLAGPGCGKTHTITEKVLYIFQKEIIPEPYGLLAITFTNYAAQIMRARLHSKGFNQWSRIWAGTFHSLGRYILGCYGGDIGIREDFEIIESHKRNMVLRKLVSKYSTDLSYDRLGLLFEELKREGRYPEQCDDFSSHRVSEAYREYNHILRERNLLDFGDLVALAVQLLQKSDFVRRLFTNFFRYIVVDEFQDTDRQQLEMIRIFAKPSIGSTIVGDDDQSIFEWRGALRQNVFRIKELLDSTEIVLGQNFRSDEIIVRAAARVIGFDPRRRKKDLRAVSKRKGHLYKCRFYDVDDEAEYVVKWIREKLNDMVNDPGDIAIITRNHYRKKWVVQEMDRSGISWFDRSRLKFKDSWETALALGIIELAHDPASSLFLYRVMASVEEGGLAYRLDSEDALDIALNIRNQLKVAKDLELHPKKVRDILNVVDMAEIIRSASAGISDAQRRTRNLEKMMKDIYSETREHGVGLLEVVNRFSGHGAIQVLSGHQAKGGEFDVVFFIGLEDDVLPDRRNHNEEKKLAEERRVFYVGLTRASKAVYLTYATHRPGRRSASARPSRFIEQIPDEYFSEIIF